MGRRTGAYCWVQEQGGAGCQWGKTKKVGSTMPFYKLSGLLCVFPWEGGNQRETLLKTWCNFFLLLKFKSFRKLCFQIQV